MWGGGGGKLPGFFQSFHEQKCGAVYTSRRLLCSTRMWEDHKYNVREHGNTGTGSGSYSTHPMCIIYINIDLYILCDYLFFLSFLNYIFLYIQYEYIIYSIIEYII